MITNSFSRSPTEPNRFHVIMFYKRPATSIDQHKAIVADVIGRLEANGFRTAVTGPITIVSRRVHSFYLPATNRKRPEWAFFNRYGIKTRELERCAIDPADYHDSARPCCCPQIGGQLQ